MLALPASTLPCPLRPGAHVDTCTGGRPLAAVAQLGNVDDDTKDEADATLPNQDRRRRWSWHASGAGVVNGDPLWQDLESMRARLLCEP